GRRGRRGGTWRRPRASTPTRPRSSSGCGRAIAPRARSCPWPRAPWRPSTRRSGPSSSSSGSPETRAIGRRPTATPSGARRAAYRHAERSKAGVGRDALNEAEARSCAGTPAALLGDERKLRQDLAAADHRLNEALEERGEETAVQPLREARFALIRRYEALQQ